MKMATKIYERLTPDERFRAFIEAAARHDEEELDRLNATCPMKGYDIEDPAYFIPKTNAMMLTLAAHLEASRHSELASFTMAMLMFGDIEHEEKAIMALGTFVRRYRTQMLGFERFCEEIGISAEIIRQALGCRVGPMTKMALTVAEDYPDAEPVPAEVDAVADRLLATWRVPGVV